MARQVSSMGPSELLELVRGGKLDDMDVLDVLRNPYCTTEIAELIADSRQWLTSHVVRQHLAGFRGMPVARAMNLLATLPWTSLQQIIQEPRTPPVVRRQAERKLLDRLQKMTLGERIALARSARRSLFPRLIAGREPEVLAALLNNPQLVENDILVILNTIEPPTAFFRELATHWRWGQYIGVRRALVECPHVPLPLALSALVSLGTSDLLAFSQRRDLRGELREAAEALRKKKLDANKKMVRFSGDGGGQSTSDSTGELRRRAPTSARERRDLD